MPSIKDLKKRIGTVKNTQQTTRAMKMVSAAKLRRAQEAIQSQRPYAKQIADLIKQLVTLAGGKVQLPLLTPKESNDSEKSKKILYVMVSSDRGLCGGFNSNVIKAGQRQLNAYQGVGGTEIQVSFVGRKAHEFYKTKKVQVAHYYAEAGGKVTFAKAKKVAQSLVDSYLSGEFDEIKIIYNEFKNAVTQKVVVEDFLPLKPKEESTQADEGQSDFIIKPNLKDVLHELLTKNFAIQMFRILLESQAGEHGARMSAMENATKNAGEMIRKLALQYNKQRQAGITKELLEIISGSESQKG